MGPMAPEVAVVGLCDVLMDAGKDHLALTLLAEAQEAGLLSLWKTKRKEAVELGGWRLNCFFIIFHGFCLAFGCFGWFLVGSLLFLGVVL